MNNSFNTTVSRDLFNAVCGNLLGEGIGRKVYECKIDKSLVVKLEESGFQNVKEWEIWQEVKNYTGKLRHIKDSFAPCEYISPCGIFLFQKKTEKATRNMYPEKMPSYLLDRKYSNFGLYEGRLVCHDYGMQSLCNGYKLKMVNADWWDDTD